MIIFFILISFLFIVTVCDEIAQPKKKYHICGVSALWNVKYQLFYAYRLKVHSIQQSSPNFFDAQFLVTDRKDSEFLGWAAEEGITIVSVNKTTQLLSGENYKYFLTKLKLFDDRILDICDHLVFSDSDVYAMNDGFTGIDQACPENADVCMTGQSRALCVGLECCDRSLVLVQNSGVMFMRNPRKIYNALVYTLENSGIKFSRDQHLWGHIFCNTELLILELLPDRYNANWGWEKMDDPRIIHYTAGPDLFSPELIPLDNSAYGLNSITRQFRNYSFVVDPCFSQSNTKSCENRDGHVCQQSKDLCYVEKIEKMTPISHGPRKKNKGFEQMSCMLAAGGKHTFDLFGDCGISCDIFPLIEARCDREESKNPFKCVYYIFIFVHDTFFSRPGNAKLYIEMWPCIQMEYTVLYLFMLLVAGGLFVLGKFWFAILMCGILLAYYYRCFRQPVLAPVKDKQEDIDEEECLRPKHPKTIPHTNSIQKHVKAVQKELAPFIETAKERIKGPKRKE